MRRLLLLVLVLVLAVVVVIGALHRGGDSGSPSIRSGSVSLVGDSLNVGIEPYLERYLAGWRIEANDQSGRPTAAGIDELRATRSGLEPALVISLGTNDDAAAVPEFRRDVRTVLRIAGSRRCVAWLTIARDGDAYASFNETLAEEARRSDTLVLVDWAGMVREHPEWLGADGIHATAVGYDRRAEAVANALRKCTHER